MVQAPPRAPGPAPRRPPRFVLIATLVVLLLGGTTLAAVFLSGPLLRDRIAAEARARGVELTFDGVAFWGFTVSLDGVRFHLVGLPGIDGRAARIGVALSGWDPASLDATAVQVDVTGSAADLALALGEWTKNHPGAYQVPVSAKGLGVTWRASATEAPWLTVEGGSMSGTSAGVSFTAAHAVVSGLDVGSVGASWSAGSAAVTMGFGTADAQAAPIRVTVQHAASPPTATITLIPTDLGKLAGPLGIPLPAPGVIASGQVDLRFTRGLEAGPITGEVQARLDGWVPPHPVELDGFLFGGATAFTSHLDVTADRSTVQLSQSRVVAGAFDLRGSGRIDRQADHATISMTLGGNVPCSAVAESAAAAHVGSFLAEIIGGAARRVVQGSVAVHVKITADSRQLGAARVDPSIGVGCGLTPVRNLAPAVLQHLPQRLQDFANALPTLQDLTQ